MTLQEKIAALPKWPTVSALLQRLPDHYTGTDVLIESTEMQRDAALARLALAKEWIGDMHQWGCAALQEDAEGWSGLPCDCGRDALLAALEGP